MDTLVNILSGIILGAISMYWGYNLLRKRSNRELTQKQSTVLLDKIKSVCKLITIEGEFAEIYHHENTKEHFMGLISSKKKALIIVNAKAHIGFDMKKIKMHADNTKKCIVITEFPLPEVISIEPDLRYYDIKNGLFNKFASDDLTKLNKEAKQQILDKIPESSLMDTAKKEMLETVLLIEKIVATIGWKLDYTALKISNRELQFIENE